MKLPFLITGFNDFRLYDLEAWVALHKPKEIEMTDKQYAHYADLCMRNSKHYKSIPIVFLDQMKA